jgi:hypothetical protein
MEERQPACGTDQKKIAEWEPLLFSKNPEDKMLYRKKIEAERDRLMSLLNVTLDRRGSGDRIL